MVLIRSQNGIYTVIFKKSFNVYNDGTIYVDGDFFGSYKTQERAKQVQADFESFWLGCHDEKAIYYMPKD